jgi:hypothetical protein
MGRKEVPVDTKYLRYRAECDLLSARLDAARARLVCWDDAREDLRHAEHNLYQWAAEVRSCSERVRAAELRLRWLRRDAGEDPVRVAVEIPDAMQPTYADIAAEALAAHREGRERDHALALVFLYDFQLACHQRNTDVHEVCRDARIEAAQVLDESGVPEREAPERVVPPKRSVN